MTIDSRPHFCPCTIVGQFARLVAVLALLLALAGAIAELALRKIARVQPAVLAATGLSPVVPDGWTGYRLRPSVPGPPEWIITNDLGMHAPRTYPLGKRARGKLRVAMLGSSVVYGLGQYFEYTIPAAAERALRQGGRRAEVLNFGTHSFNVVNISAMTQAYVHQFRPDAIVVVIDFPAGLPYWPIVTPAVAPSDMGIRKLGWREALLKRASEHSALFTVIDDPSTVRPFVRRVTRLPLEPELHPARPSVSVAAVSAPLSPLPSAGNVDPRAGSVEEIRAYEEKRRRDLAAPLAAMAAFCQEQSIALYFMTPYGPYFDLTDDELKQINVHPFLVEARRVYGSERRALAAEVETITAVVSAVAAAHSAQVIDMLEASRHATLRGSSDFTGDGIHFTAAGNVAVGKLIAARIAADFPPRPR